MEFWRLNSARRKAGIRDSGNLGAVAPACLLDAFSLIISSLSSSPRSYTPYIADYLSLEALVYGP